MTKHGEQSCSRAEVRSEKGKFPGNIWEDATVEGRTYRAWGVANVAITAVAATKLRLRQRRIAGKQTWWARLTETLRRTRNNARDASMRAREAAAEPVSAEHRGRMATVMVGVLVAVEWLRRHRNAGSDDSQSPRSTGETRSETDHA